MFFKENIVPVMNETTRKLGMYTSMIIGLRDVLESVAWDVFHGLIHDEEARKQLDDLVAGKPHATEVYDFIHSDSFQEIIKAVINGYITDVVPPYIAAVWDKNEDEFTKVLYTFDPKEAVEKSVNPILDILTVIVIMFAEKGQIEAGDVVSAVHHVLSGGGGGDVS